MKDYDSIDDILDSLRYRSKFSSTSELGFKDLKNERSRASLEGMARAYLIIQRADMEVEFGSGSDQLDSIIEELRIGAVDRALDELAFAMEELLTAAIDYETEESEG